MFKKTLEDVSASGGKTTVGGKVEPLPVTAGTRSQRRYGLDASCGFCQLDASLSSSSAKPVSFIKLHQVFENQT